MLAPGPAAAAAYHLLRLPVSRACVIEPRKVRLLYRRPRSDIDTVGTVAVGTHIEAAAIRRKPTWPVVGALIEFGDMVTGENSASVEARVADQISP